MRKSLKFVRCTKMSQRKQISSRKVEKKSTSTVKHLTAQDPTKFKEWAAQEA